MTKVTLAADDTFEYLSSSPTSYPCTISCVPTNTANVTFKDSEGVEVPWVPGEFHSFPKGVDLSRIQVKGTTGDIVTIINGSY